MVVCLCLHRKHPDGRLSQLQIILCAKQPPAESSQQSGSPSTTQQAKFPQTGASSPLCSAAQTNPTAEAHPAASTYADTNRLDPCQLAALSAPKLLAGHAQDSMIADQGGLLQQQAEQCLPPLPDNIAALVKQHQLKVQLVQVTIACPFHMPLSHCLSSISNDPPSDQGVSWLMRPCCKRLLLLTMYMH